MLVFVAAGFRGRELRLLNEIRLFLQALTVADIATADGRRIQQSVYDLSHPCPLRCGYAWPTIIPITSSERTFLQRALACCFCAT